jgi:glucose-1-phosphate cytidylyltransferase
MPRLVEEKQLVSYHHNGFWQPMDTLREKHDLEKLALLNPPSWLENV